MLALVAMVTKSGKYFDIIDNWMLPANAHKKFSEQFVGFTVFSQVDSPYSNLKNCDGKGGSWADASE